MHKKPLSHAQIEVLTVLERNGPLETSSHTAFRWISGTCAETLCRFGLAETARKWEDGIAGPRLVKITDLGREALTAALREGKS